MKADGNKYWYYWRQGFVLVYFFLSLFLFPFKVFPGVEKIVSVVVKAFWDFCVVWTGDHILPLESPISVQPNGRGDRKNNYVQMLVQFFLAFTMLSYDLHKLIKIQFPPLSLEILLQPLRDLSPMRLARTFWRMRTVYGTKRPHSHLYGIYSADAFWQNGMVLPPLKNEYTGWKTLIFNYSDHTSIEFIDGVSKRYATEINSVNYLFTTSNYGDATFRYSPLYEKSENDKISFEGYWRGDTLEVIATGKDPGSFELNKRGLDWINECPYNL